MSLNQDSCFMPQPTSPHHPGSSQPVILLQFKHIIPRRTSTPQEQLAKHSVYGHLIVGGSVEMDSGAHQTQVKRKRPDQLQLHARWECFLSRPEFPIATFSYLCVCLQSVFMAAISCSVKSSVSGLHFFSLLFWFQVRSLSINSLHAGNLLVARRRFTGCFLTGVAQAAVAVAAASQVQTIERNA